jgi:hypothetical protein
MDTTEIKAKADRLRARLAAEESMVENTRAALRDAEHQLSLRRLRDNAATARDAGISELIDPDPAYRGEADYILPFGKDYAKWDPFDVDGHPFGKDWLAGMYALICTRTDVPRTHPSRIVHGSGSLPGDRWRIGNTWTFRRDQTGAKLGVYKVVGIVIYDEHGDVLRAAGKADNRKLSLATFK